MQESAGRERGGTATSEAGERVITGTEPTQASCKKYLRGHRFNSHKTVKSN